MSRVQPSGSNRDLTETFQEVLTGVAKVLTWISAGATLIGVGFLFFTIFATTSGSPAVDKQAINNVETLEKVLYAGLVGLAVGSTYLWWGEQLLGAFQIILAVALYTAPLYVPSMTSNLSEPGKHALQSLQTGGIIFGVIGIVVIIVDVALKTKDRMSHGSKSDQLKYGKGVKEERQNVFMGKCWQLPFCRKFVRERCPIYHSQRTCWRELVGCMCEEEVIRNAMDNKVISKDALVAASMIPRNNRLTVDQKRERCKSCVIYNEHQRHKYRLSLPILIAFFGLVYGTLHTPLVAATNTLVMKTSGVINGFTLGNSNIGKDAGIFAEILLVVFFILALTYSLKVLEYVIFKLKL